jgi:hypothetical protein
MIQGRFVGGNGVLGRMVFFAVPAGWRPDLLLIQFGVAQGQIRLNREGV